MNNPSQRQLRVAELLRRRLAELLQKGEAELPAPAPAITEIRLSADLKLARAYVMPLQGKNIKQVVEQLNASAPRLRKMMMQGVRLKFAPALKFYADDMFAYAQQIDGLLDSPNVRRDTQQKQT